MSDNRDIRLALVGDEHLDLYRNNAWFKSAVDTLADMLPLMVNGFAAEAVEQNGKREALMHVLRTQAGPSFTGPGA